MISATDSTYTGPGYIGLRVYNFTGSTQSGLFNNFGVASALTGTWQSPATSIASAGTYGQSIIMWDTDQIPDNTTAISVQTSVNGGTTWTGVANGGYIPGLTVGQSLAGVNLLIKVTITATNAPIVAFMQGISVWVMGQYISTGTRSNAPLINDTMVRANVGSGFGTSTDGQSYAQVGTGTTNLTSNEAQIVNTTGDVHMVAGSNTAQDTNESIRFSLSASTMTAGLELHYNDANHYYRLVATTTALTVVRNSGAGNVTVATSSVALSTGTFYRMRFRAVSAGLTSLTLYGRVWLDGSQEPTTWNVQIADSPYKPTILADSPIRYYRLDDTNTTAIDIGSGAHNGTLHGTITESQTGLLRGDTDTAMLFDGSTGYVSLPTTGLPTGTASWTLEAWCQIPSVPSGQYSGVLAMGNNASLQEAGLFVYVSGGLAYPYLGVFGGAGSNDIQSTTPMSLNTPYFFSGSYDGTNIRLYVNGVLVAGPHAVTLNLVQNYAAIGSGLPVPLQLFPGIIDDPAIYSTALSAQQILNHYNAGIISGAFAIYAAGTGTARFDSYNVTMYPDPTQYLTTAGRAVNSIADHNSNIPANTNVAVHTSIDGGATYQPVANPGDMIPGIGTMAYYNAVRANHPVAFYRLNEKSGLVAYDSSNNGYDGTIVGGVTLGQIGGLQGVNEIGDTAMLFDSSTGYITLPSAVTTNSLTALTVECWLNPTVIPPTMNARVLANSHTDSDVHGFQLAVASTSPGGFPTGSAGTVGFDIGNGSVATQINSTSQLVAGTWTYVVVSWDGSNLRLYWNGSLQSTVAFTGPISSTTFPINIGRNPVYAGDYFGGIIQGVALYSTALSTAAITAHYNAATIATQAVYDDTFTTNTSANYTQTNGVGGATAAWTWDTANSRIKAVGGSKAVLLWNNVTASDVDLLLDIYQSENGGLIWGWQDASDYYELVVKDAGASSGANTLTLNKISSGTSTQLATGAITFPVSTYHRVYVTMQSGVIVAYFDNVQILTYTDGSPFSGQAGLRNDTGTSYVYELQITPLAPSVSGLAVYTRHTLTTSDPTATPQILDAHTMASDGSFGLGATVPSADYNQKYVSDNLDNLNTQSNYWYTINFAKNITFTARNANNAPWILQSSDVQVAGVTVEYGADLYRNRQTLQGVYQTTSYTEIKNGDGSTRTWNVANPIAAGVPTIMLNGLPATIGVQNVDTGRQFYYQIGGTAITQDNSQTILKTSDSFTIVYTGTSAIDFTIDNTGQFPGTISQSQLAALDNTTGVIESIEDVSQQNMNVAAATVYANQLLQRYGSIARTISFVTLHPGLQQGHNLPVFIPELNIFDSYFLVVEVNTTVRTLANGQLQYVFSCVASESAALASWVKMFSKLLRSVK